jgi:hypothetical protein
VGRKALEAKKDNLIFVSLFRYCGRDFFVNFYEGEKKVLFLLEKISKMM